MKLLMTADAVGGVWTYAVDLAHTLCQRGWQVTIAVLGPPPTNVQRQHARSVRGVQLEEAAYRLEWMADPWDDVRAAGDWLGMLVDRIAPDIIHLNGYALAERRFGVPAVVVAHSCVLSW